MKHFFLIAVVLVFASCVEGIKRFEEPKNLVERGKMVEVLTDLVKLESHVKSKYVGVNQFHKIMVNSGDSLFKVHGITQKQFDESMSYYGSRQDEMQEMYSEALENLNKELGELQSEK